MQEAETFIASLVENAPQDSYLTLTAIHPERHKAVPSQHLPVHDKDKQADSLAKLFATNQMGWGAFVGIAYRTQGLGRYQRGGKDNLIALPALFVDIDHQASDLKNRLRQIPTPTWQIASSETGRHLYWLLEEPSQEWQGLEEILFGLAQFLGADSSMSSDQSMRLPGSINWKAQRPASDCQILDFYSKRYPIEAFQAFASAKLLKAQTTRASRKKSSSAISGQLNPQLMQAITERLIRDYGAVQRPNGWYLCQCIFTHQHQRERHGAWHPEKGLYNCFGKHGQALSHEVAKVLKISIAAYDGLYLNENSQSERKSYVPYPSSFRSSTQ